jgi:hypothetical protein
MSMAAPWIPAPEHAPVSPSLAQRMATAVLTLLPIAASAVVYFPITRAYFFADDFIMLGNLVDQGFLRFVLQMFGGHLLVFRNLVFFLTYQLSGLNPAPYYWTVFLTHLLNVWLLVRVTRSFTGSSSTAAFGATLWGTCPLAIGTLGWYAVYGQVLVATIVLILLNAIAGHIERGDQPSPLEVVIWYVMLLVGATCFGIGIGVALAFPFVLFLLLPALLRRRSMTLFLLTLPAAVAALYLGLSRVNASLQPPSVEQAVLQSIALKQYGPVVLMLAHLHAISLTGLILGPYFSVDRYPDLTSHLVVALVVLSSVLAWLFSNATIRRMYLALLVLSCSMFFMVAIGRANLLFMLGKVPPDAAARPLRYYYAGLIPPVIILSLTLASMLQPLGRAARSGLFIALIALLSYGMFEHRPPIDTRAAARKFVLDSVEIIERRIEEAPPGRDVYIENAQTPWDAGPLMNKTQFPGTVGVFALVYPTNVVRGHRIHFVERDAAVVKEMGNPKWHPRFAVLLVGTENVPATTSGPQ